MLPDKNIKKSERQIKDNNNFSMLKKVYIILKRTVINRNKCLEIRETQKYVL